MIEEINKISRNIGLSLNDLLENKENLANNINIETAEIFGNTENLRELKLTLIEINFDSSEFEILKEELIKLKIINRIIFNPEIIKFIKKTEEFICNYIEFNEIWKILDWKNYYDIFGNEIYLYSSKKALIRKIPITSEYITTINKIINQRARDQYKAKIGHLIKKLIGEIKSIEKVIKFELLISKLRTNAFNSYSDSLKQEWSTLIKDNRLTQAQYSVLAFILRTSIELSLKNHPLIIADTSNIKMLGGIFKKLQQNGIFVNERTVINENLSPLNKLIHNEIIEVTKEQIISIKEYFASLLATQNLELAF